MRRPTPAAGSGLAAPQAPQWKERSIRYARLVRLPHTGFALPFALVGAILASYRYPVRPMDVVWIVVAFSAARFAAMGFNRIVDREFDRHNPRTADRELPSGRMRVGEASAAVAVASAVFVGAAALLNPLCLALTLPTLAVLFGYSYAKRYTEWTHLFLGVADGIAPAAGFLAVSGRWSDPWILLPLLLGAVALWVAGFDILYAFQDVEVDRRLGLRSLPVRLGQRRAHRVAAAFHVGTVLCLGALPVVMPELGTSYLAGIAAVALLLGLEHGMVDPDNPRTVERAFFTVNVWLASVFAIFVLVGRLL